MAARGRLAPRRPAGGSAALNALGVPGPDTTPQLPPGSRPIASHRPAAVVRDDQRAEGCGNGIETPDESEGDMHPLDGELESAAAAWSNAPAVQLVAAAEIQ